MLLTEDCENLGIDRTVISEVVQSYASKFELSHSSCGKMNTEQQTRMTDPQGDLYRQEQTAIRVSPSIQECLMLVLVCEKSRQ